MQSKIIIKFKTQTQMKQVSLNYINY